MAVMGNMRGVQVEGGCPLGREASDSFIPVRAGLGSLAMLAVLQGRCRRVDGSLLFPFKAKQPSQGSKCQKPEVGLEDLVSVKRY